MEPFLLSHGADTRGVLMARALLYRTDLDALIAALMAEGREVIAPVARDGAIVYEGRGPIAPIGAAGDVVFFVSDVWHRRMPTGPDDTGRFFLQMQYGRRDIAQRLRTTDRVHHLSSEAVERAVTERDRTVAGLHPAGFYDG